MELLTCLDLPWLQVTLTEVLRNMMYFIIISGSEFSPQRTARRVFWSCYLILTLTVIAIYKGNLIAFLTIPKLKSSINSLEELAEHPEFQAGFQAGSSNHDLFKVRE